jgi:branched-chain amino acid transport system permease protein
MELSMIQRSALKGPAAGPLFVTAFGLVGFFCFPQDLALLRSMAIGALFAMSLDLVVGYCGVGTLGHAALFGAGAYAAGIANVHGLSDPLLLLGVGAMSGVAAAAVTGALILRTQGLPQLVLSIATVQLVSELANKASGVTGGSDGLSGIEPGKVFGQFGFDIYGKTGYLLSLGVLVLLLVLASSLVRSPFGLLCRGIKQDRVRVRAMGSEIFPPLLKMYLVSGAMAGVAGALAAVTTGVVGLDSLSFEKSAGVLVMLIIGGTGWLYGGVLGAAAFVALEHVVSAANPFHWMTIVGAVLISVVIFLPSGLRSLVERIGKRFAQ